MRYAALNDLQAVMDEWLHLIANDETTPSEIEGAVERVLSVHQSAISVQGWRSSKEERKRVMRGHVAMRLASASGDWGGGLKAVLEDKGPADAPAPDPWAIMFGDAERAGSGGDGRIPSWVLEGTNSVERIALMPPFSRERGRYERVRRDLTVYRLAFGQARQDDLLEHLRSATDDGSLTAEGLDELQITLRP